MVYKVLNILCLHQQNGQKDKIDITIVQHLQV